MNANEERSRSVWMNVEVAPDATKLGPDASADTVVVGSGIAGLSTAYELSGQGQKIIVLDRGTIGGGMTARTSAHLTANNDDGFSVMMQRRGADLSKMFYESQAAAICGADLRNLSQPPSPQPSAAQQGWHDLGARLRAAPQFLVAWHGRFRPGLRSCQRTACADSRITLSRH